METLLRFRKDGELHNILYDDFFHQAEIIDFITFNYDNNGSAICTCDGVLQVMDLDRVNRIVFGVEQSRLDAFISSIYNPDILSDDLTRIAGKIQFHQAELNALDKYEIGNLAKKTHKDLLEMTRDPFQYYALVLETKNIATQASPGTESTEAFYGNVNTQVYHQPDCKNYNSASCTAVFKSKEDAETAGYRLCKMCEKG